MTVVKRIARAELLLLMAAVIVALAIGEGVARLSGAVPVVYRLRSGRPKSAYEISKNPVLGYELKKNHRDAAPDNIESFAATNTDGQRDVERAYARVPGVPRIELLGDSVVAGLGIAKLDDTLPRQLELSFGPKRPVEVLNMGLVGYNTMQEAELLRVKGVRYEPDLVVLVFVQNDFSDVNTNIWAYSFPRPAAAERLFVHSSLFRLLALRFDWFHLRSELDQFYQQNWNLSASGTDNVERGFARIRELMATHRFALAVFLWPSFDDEKAEYRSHHQGRAPGALRVEEIAAAAGLSAFRLDGALNSKIAALKAAGAMSPSDTVRSYMTNGDGVHPSPEGVRVAAEVFKDTIVERFPGVVSRAAGPK